MFKYFKFGLLLLFKVTPSNKIRLSILRMAGFNVGLNAYIPRDIEIADVANRKKTVDFGDRVSIGPNVIIVADSSPNNSILKKIYPLISKNVCIEHDSWLGAGVIVLPGVTIGHCSIIGAGSVVTKSIPPYSIAVGSPARVVSQIDPSVLTN